MSAASTQPLESIEALLLDIEKSANAHTEAGGYQGETEHPSKKPDDGTETAVEGSRAKENDQDIKEEQGGAGVDGEPDVKAAATTDQDGQQLNIGTKQKATGEDPSCETSSAKGGKDDGGYTGPSSHPARTDNDALDGHKYAAPINQFRGMMKTATDLGNNLLGAIGVDAVERTKAAGGEQAQPQANAQPGDNNASKQADNQPAQAGEQLVDTILGQVSLADKQAMDNQAIEDIAQTLIGAYRLADQIHEFHSGVHHKSAMGEENGSLPPDRPNDGGETPPEESNGQPGGGGDIDETELLAALAGGGDMGGGEMPGGMPEGMGGDMGPLAEPSPPAMGPGPEMGPGMGEPNPEDLAMLLQALEQAGVTPQQYEAKAASYFAKAASALDENTRKTLLNWKPKTAEQGQQLQSMVNHVKEICK